jgi:predicted membrane protein
MNTDHLTLRALSFAMAAVLTVSMLIGIDTLATQQHAGSELMAQTPATSAPRG